MKRTARMLLALLAATAMLLPAGCGGRSSSESEESTAPAPPVPERYKGLEAVYSLTGSSFYATSFADGKQRLLFNAEGDVNAATFAAWVPERSELVYESITETGRELWLFSSQTGKQERVSQNLDAVIGVRGGREVLFAGDAMEGPGLRAYDLQTKQSTMLLKGAFTAVPGHETVAPVCFAGRTEDGRQELFIAAESGAPASLAVLPAGRQAARAIVFEGAVVVHVLMPGAGEYGQVVSFDRESGRSTVLAEEAKLLDAAADGGVLVQKNLRGGVSGVTRSLVAYVPSGEAAASRSALDLGAYAGTVHAAALVAGGGKALVSQRLEGSNRVDLYDLTSGSSELLSEDPDLQVNRIVPLDEDSVAGIRMRPGLASGGGEGESPSISSLEDEIVWIPLSPDAEDVTILATASGPIGLLGVFERK